MGSTFDLLVGHQDLCGSLRFRCGHVDEGADQTLRSKLFFLILILMVNNTTIVNFTMASAQYGEDSEGLDQFTDNFENMDYVSVNVSVVNNVTLECMELYYSAGLSRALENFTEYTQVEEGNEIDVQNATYLEFFDKRTRTSYIYYDYGVNHFKDFTHFIDVYRDTHGSSAWMALHTLSNYVGGDKAHRTNNEPYIGVTVGGSNPNMRFMEFDGAAFFSSTAFLMVLDTWYYVNWTKIGDYVEMNVYSTYNLREIGGAGDVLSVNQTLQSDYQMRYAYAGNTYDDNSNPEGESDLRNYWYGDILGGYSNEGYFSTEDYLNYSDGESLVLMTNTTIPTDTAITVQFSEDNTTWLNNEGAAGSNSLIDGFLSLDLRDLNYSDIFVRYNLTSVDSVDTPRVFQSRMISTGPVSGGVTVTESDAPWVALAIILSIIAGLLFSGIRTWRK